MLDSLSSCLSLLTALLQNQMCFILLVLVELLDLLLLGHYFVQSFDFFLFDRLCSHVLLDSFDFLDALVEVLGFADDVVLLPILRSLLPNLQLDLQ